MTSKKIELTQDTVNDASKAELLAFGADVCGIEFTGEEHRDYIIVQICEAMDWVVRNPEDDATHVVVRLGKEPGKLGELGYRGGFNGRMFTIPREVEVEIPIEFFNTIRDSHNRGFTVSPLNDMGLEEGSPIDKTINVSGVPMTVLKFLNKGK